MTSWGEDVIILSCFSCYLTWLPEEKMQSFYFLEVMSGNRRNKSCFSPQEVMSGNRRNKSCFSPQEVMSGNRRNKIEWYFLRRKTTLVSPVIWHDFLRRKTTLVSPVTWHDFLGRRCNHSILRFLLPDMTSWGEDVIILSCFSCYLTWLTEEKM
jgi:hypothetical protein